MSLWKEIFEALVPPPAEETWQRAKLEVRRKEEMFDGAYVNGPSIDRLSQEWITKIQNVARDSATPKIIERYHEIKPNRFKRYKRSFAAKNRDEAKQDIAMHHAHIEQRRIRHRIEMRLAAEFVDELLQCCERENPDGFNAEMSQFNSNEERKNHILILLTDTAPKPIPVSLEDECALTAPEFPWEEVTYSSIIEEKERKAKDTRFHELEKAHEIIDQKKQGKGIELSLADTLNGIWSETIHPRLKQPSEPQLLPHIYSIVEEILGNRKEITVIPNANGSTLTIRTNPSRYWAKKVTEPAPTSIGQNIP